LNIYIPAK
jgi:hypothetical protein